MAQGLKICKKFNCNKNNAHNTAPHQGSKMLHKTVLLQYRRMIHLKHSFWIHITQTEAQVNSTMKNI